MLYCRLHPLVSSEPRGRVLSHVHRSSWRQGLQYCALAVFSRLIISSVVIIPNVVVFFIFFFLPENTGILLLFI